MNLTPIPIAEERPPDGLPVEIAGFGGPGKKLRHWWAATKADGTLASSVLNGDSGSPIVSGRGVIGVVSGGYDRQAFHAAEDRGQWFYVSPVVYSVPTPLRNGLRAIVGAPRLRAYSQNWFR